MPAVVQALLAENEGSTSTPGGSIDSDALDEAFGDTVGALLRRGITGWELIAPGTEDQVLKMQPFGSPEVLLPDWGTATGGGGGFSHSASPPVSPNEGDRWVDEDTGIQYTYYNDGNTSQWVEF